MLLEFTEKLDPEEDPPPPCCLWVKCPQSPIVLGWTPYPQLCDRERKRKQNSPRVKSSVFLLIVRGKGVSDRDSCCLLLGMCVCREEEKPETPLGEVQPWEA